MTHNISEIHTPRLILRQWKTEDLPEFARMNADEQVMRFFPATMTPEQTQALYERIQREFVQRGYGLYAAQLRNSGEFIGFIGFHRAEFDADFCPCVEIGWRLSARHWGQGYAPEGARACLEHGFSRLGLDAVYSFTAVVNEPSQRVMQKIGMKQHCHFDHPNVAQNDRLRPHVCYRIVGERPEKE